MKLSEREEPKVREMMDLQVWAQRREEMMREAEQNRLAKAPRVAANLLWVLGSVALVVTGWPLTALGVAFVLAQGAAVFLFADLQFLGMRRSRPATG